ncbi:MAG: PQQ-binding-like beta-propeller repeat protein [Planctomycetes bacterium]|nr:PQQ-binding-like beta-propeller repeat protein [Planctomycetota bacterium]
MKKRHVFTIVILLTLFLTPSALAENWPHWRGPNFNGTSNEKNLPLKFSKTKNVRWVAKLPGKSASTPIIWQDHVFLSSLDETNDGLLAICLDRRSGKILWKKQVAIGPAKDSRSNMAAPSPVTDGNVVVFFYSTGDLVAFNLDGKELWQRNITDDYGQFAFGWTFSSSLTMFGGKLYLPVMQRDEPVRGRGRLDKNGTIESFLLCMDPQTGKTIYKHVRPSRAKMESLEAFTTIIPFVHNGREELLLAGGDCITGHDPKTGKELWRWGTWNPRRQPFWRLVPSPVAGAGSVWACAPKGSPIYAVKAGGVGDLSSNGLQWQSSDKTISTDVCTPAFYDGKLFVLNGEKKYISCLNPKSGDIIWQTELGGRIIYRSSPTIADGKIYCMNHRAEITVLNAKTGDILSQSKMGEPNADMVRASVAVAQSNLFIRTNYHLYCIENSASTSINATPVISVTNSSKR